MNALNNAIFIYIPIWLDLLLEDYQPICHIDEDLHSNMVRFIMNKLLAVGQEAARFTFQYG